MKKQEAVSDQKLKCPVCDHKLISHKSLYGHMRNHPDKNWGGTKPPFLGSIALGKPDLFLHGWLKTGRRSTRPGKWNKLSENEAYKSSVVENGRPAEVQNLPPKKRKLENNNKMENPGPESLTKEKNYSNSILFYDTNVGYNFPNLRAYKPHICDICKRCFKSYQALGGHKAHHNNKRHKIISLTDEDNEFSTTNSVVVYAEGHKCPFCGKMFSKGQALGGHKRHCWSKERKNRSMVFRFDLNELPSE